MNAPHALLVVDRVTARYVGASATAERLLGYSHSELVALGPRDLTPVEDLAGLATALASLEESGRWTGTWRLKRKDGSIVQAVATTKIVAVADRVLYQGVFRDASEPAELSSVSLLNQLAELCDAHSRPSLGFAYAFLRDQNMAEEAVEDTLLAAWRAGVSAEPDTEAARVIVNSVLRRTLARYAGRRSSH